MTTEMLKFCNLAAVSYCIVIVKTKEKYNVHVCFFLQCDCLCFFITDSVVRTVYYKYFHPKEVLISNGVLNR